jgi:hypothetical protein
VDTYADKEIRGESMGYHKIDKTQKRARMQMQTGAGAMMYSGRVVGRWGSWPEVMVAVAVSVPPGSCAAGATWPTCQRLTDVAAMFTNTKNDETMKRKTGNTRTYASESESSVSRLLATLLCSPKESSLWFRGSKLGRLT